MSVSHSKPYAKKASFYRYAKIAEPFCIEAHGSFLYSKFYMSIMYVTNMKGETFEMYYLIY